MSVAAAVIGTVGAGVSTILSIKKMKDAKRMREQAQKAIREFEYQDLNSLRISTASEELMQEQSAKEYATAVESLRESGTRAQASVLPRLAAQYGEKDRRITAGLDAKQKELDKQRVGMQEQRDREMLGGYGSMMNVGMQTQSQGMTDMVNSLGNLGVQAEALSEEQGFKDLTSKIFK